MPTELPEVEEQEQEPQQQQAQGGTLAERIARRKAALQQPPKVPLAERIAARKAALQQPVVAPTPAPVAPTAPPVAAAPPKVAPPRMEGVTSGASTAVAPPPSAPKISDATREVGERALRPGATVEFKKEPRRSPNYYRLQDYKGDDAGGFGGRFEDMRAMIMKGLIGVPETLVGLADMAQSFLSQQPAGSTSPGSTTAKPDAHPEDAESFGQMAQRLGFDAKEAKDFWNERQSEAQERAHANVAAADGIVGKAKAIAQNPRVIVESLIESAPTMALGGAMSRAALAAAPGLSPVLAGAAGEGIVTSGQNLEQVRQESPTGRVTPEQAAKIGLSGAATGALSLLGGRIAQKLGIADVETMMAGAAASPVAQHGLVRRVIYGAMSEGLLEELPQSVQEQIAQNSAEGKPLWEGVDEAAVMGAITGGVMGGGANAIEGANEKIRESAVKRRIRQLTAAEKIKQTKDLLEKAGTEKPSPEEQAEFSKNATETMSEQMAARAAAGEKVPGYGQTPREDFERVVEEERKTPKRSGGVPLSATHSMLAYANGKMSKPPTGWEDMKPLDEEMAAEMKLSPEDVALHNATLKMLQDDKAYRESQAPTIRRPFEPRGNPKGGTRIATPPDFGSSIPPDDRITIGEPVPPEGKKFPATAIALKDFASEKGISIDEAAAKMRAANYDVSDETIEAAGGTKVTIPEPKDLLSETRDDTPAARPHMGVGLAPVSGDQLEQAGLIKVFEGPDMQPSIHVTPDGLDWWFTHFKDGPPEPKNLEEAALVEAFEAERKPAVSDADVKSVININGFGDFVDQLVEEHGVDEDLARRMVVRRYRNLLASGMPAKEAKGEMADAMEMLTAGEQNQDREQIPANAEVPAQQEVAPPIANETQKKKTKRVGREPEAPKSALPEGYKVEKRGDEFVIQGPDGHLRSRSWQSEDEAILQGKHAIERAKPYDWGHTPFSELKERVKGKTRGQLESRSSELVETMKGQKVDSPEWIASNEELEYIDHEVTRMDAEEGRAAAAKKRERDAESEYSRIIGEGVDARQVRKPEHMHETADDVLHADVHRAISRWISANPGVNPMKEGMPDDVLQAVLDEWGQSGQLSKLGYVSRAAKSWRLEPDEGPAIEYKGAKLLKKVRELIGIPQPGESVSTKPAKEKKRGIQREKPLPENGSTEPVVQPESGGNEQEITRGIRREEQQADSEASNGAKSQPEAELPAKRISREPAETTGNSGENRKQRVRDRVVAVLEDKAAAARERIKQRGFRAKTGLDPEELADYAIIGAAHMAKGIVELGDWSTAMIADLGESIKPHLRKIFGASIQTFNDEMEAAEAEFNEPVEAASNEGEKTEDRPRIDRGNLKINPDSQYADEEGNEESLLDGGISQAQMHYLAALELKGLLDSGKGLNGRKLTDKQRQTMEEEYRRRGGLYRLTLDEIQNAFGAAIREGVQAEIEDRVDTDEPSDILDEERVTDDAESLRDDVEGGASEQRPGDVPDAEGERAPGRDGERRGDESGRDLSDGTEPSGEGEPATEDLRGESEPHAESDGDGAREGVGVDRGRDAERGGSKRDDGRVRRPGGKRKPDAGVAGTDYRLTDADAIGEGGERAKARANIAAIELALQIKKENRPATREEQAILAKYVGWGGLKPVFEPKGEKFYQEIHDRLKELLTDEEFRAARATILNAHYTSPTVVRAMWDAVMRLGFKGGKVLEPGAGVGNFIGFMPDAVKGSTHVTAVERDRITATIASLLYPEQNVVQSPFEKHPIPDGSIDLALGNPPFGDLAIRDENIPKELRQQIHDYFFVRAVNALREGGILAFVTSDGTMDKASPTVRAYLAKHTKMVAAIRLPNTAFQKNARTSVTTDVIILQKRAETGGVTVGPSWTNTRQFVTPKGTFYINEYYASHPEQMLGTMEEGGQYSKTGDQKLVPKEGQDLEQALRERLEALPENIMPERVRDTRTETAQKGDQPLPEGATVRDGGMTIVGDEIMRREGDKLVPAGIPKTRVETVKALIGIRDAVNVVRRLNTSGASDEQLAQAQKKLRDLHEAFVKKYGPINAEERIESEPDEAGETTTRVTYPNLRSFEYDPESPFVRALEVYDYEEHQEKGAKYRPKTTDIMHRRTIAPRKSIDRADTPSDALIASLNERGGVDLDYMAELLRQPVEEVRELLRGRIFQNPENGKWETADQYLSGNVKKKLKIAEGEVQRALMHAGDIRRDIAKRLTKESAPNIGADLSKAEELEQRAKDLKENVAALEKAIPADLPPSKIAAVLGAPWVPPSTIAEFAKELLGLRTDPTVTYNKADGTWRFEVPKYARNSQKNQTDYGTSHIDGVKLLALALNMQHPNIKDEDGNKLAGPTLVADEKMEAIKEAFSTWLWKDADRAAKHARIYNEINNTTVLPSPNGDHLTLPGTATHIDGKPFAFQPHQRNFIARFLYWGRAAAFHVVGAGKTFAAIGAIMEGKRLGLIKKPIVAVPNHMLGQWTREFLQLHPGANLLVATERDFERSRRREFTARMASSDYDAIIMTHSAFERIPMSLAAQEAYILEELDDLEQVMNAARSAEGKNARIVKDLVKAQEKLQGKLDDLRAEHKKDDLLDFEELGVDHITVDEAHMFKNLQFNTALQGVKGRSSQRSVDLEMKLRYLHKVNPKHSAMLLTGTPISNTFSEAYVMQRFMQPEVLKERGLFPFDAWAKTFARERMAFEMKPDGSGFRQKSRFDRFVNLGEFAQMFRSFADIQMAHPEPLKPGEKAEDFPVEPNLIRLERPPLIGGKPEVVLVPQTPEMKEFMAHLMERAEAIKGRRAEKGADNMLSITNDGRLGALDLRTVMPDAKDSPNGKLSVAAKNIASIYHETTPFKGTQLVFSDILRSSAKGVPGFDVYDDLIGKLVKLGVPRNEIAKIHDHDSAAAKLELFMKVRAGKVRVLIGSTEKMGAGTNVQSRLVAEHQLDVRWRPSDVEQREGRILRQGNQLLREGHIKGVRILRYATEGSIDAFQWGMVTRKAGMIQQGMTADVNTREIEDIDDQAMTYAEISAAASGDKRIIRRAELDAEVGKLERLRRGHEDDQWHLRSMAERLPRILKEAEGKLAAHEADAQTVYNVLADRQTPEMFQVDIQGRTYEGKEGKEKANAALVDILKNLERGSKSRVIGKYAGLPIVVEETWAGRAIGLEGKALYDLAAAEVRPIATLEAVPNQIPREIEKARDLIEQTKRSIAETEERLGAPFPKQEQLDKAKAELLKLNVELSDKKESTDPTERRPRTDEDDVDEDFYGDGSTNYSLSPRSRETLASLGSPKRGPSIEAIGTPAADDTPLGARIRAVLGMKPDEQSAAVERVKSLRTIVKNLSNMVDVPVRQGRFLARQRKARGVFFVKPEVARVIRMDMLDTAAHEVGHYVSKHYLGFPTRRGISRDMGHPKMTAAMKKELVKLGKDLYGDRRPSGGYGEEGIAEWMNFYVTSPGKISAEAPEFTKWMESNVLANEPGLKAALEQARQDFIEYRKAPATARVDAMMDVKPKTRWRPSIRGFINAWLDDLHEFRAAVDELGGAENMAKDAYILARLSRGSAGAAEEMVENGVIDGHSGKRVTRGLKAILEDVGRKNIQKFRRYLIAERAIELAQRGIDSGIGLGDAVAVRDMYRDQFGELAEELWEMSHALIRYRASKGLLTPNEAKTIMDRNQRRVGFYRVFEEDERSAGLPTIGVRGFARNSSGLQKIRGSARSIIDPLESMITDIYKTVGQAHAAEVMRALVKQAEDTEGGGRVVEILTEVPKRAVHVDVEQVKWQLQELGIQVPNILDEQMGVLTAFENLSQGGSKERKDLVMPIVIDGKRRWIQLKDARLYDAVAGLGTPQMPMWLRVVSIPTRTLRAGATLNPEFSLRNPFRDAWQAAVYSKGGLTVPGYHVVRGLFHLFKSDGLYQEWRLAKGDNAAALGIDRPDVVTHLYSLMHTKKKPLFDSEIAKLAFDDTYKSARKRGLSHNAASRRAAVAAASESRGWVLRPIDTLRMLSSILENATRLTEYERVKNKAMERGASTEDAKVEGAYASRDLTLDFNKAGVYGRQVNQIMAFFNANLLGWQKNVEEFRANPATFVAKWTAYMTIPSLLLWLGQKDDEDFKKIPEWQKAIAWIIIDRDANGNLKHIWRIPKPPELGLLFATVPVKIAEYVTEHDPKALDHLVGSGALGQLNPVHMPDGLQPLIEWWANKNAFTGRNIVPEGLEKLPAEEQATSRTGEFARQIGRATNASPAKIENTIKGYTAGLGQYGMDIGNMVTRAARDAVGAEPFPKPPESSDEKFTKIPGLRGFTVRKPQLDAQPIQDALDAFERADGRRIEWRRRVERGDSSAKSYFEEHKAEITAVAATTDGLDEVGPLRLAHDAIVDAQRASRDADPAKRDELAAQALQAAEAALKNLEPPRGIRRGLRRAATQAEAEGQKRLRRIGRE